MSSSTYSRGIDHRDPLIEDRLSRISYIVMVGSGKGGVGKTLISTLMSLNLARSGWDVGLLDLDLHGPSSTSIFIGLDKPVEGSNGLIPPRMMGLKIMSIDLFASGRPLPLRGGEKSEVIKEVIALTDWGRLDYLIVDMPPETGDVLLTCINVLRGRRGMLVVTIPSILSLRVASRLIEIVRGVNLDILGVVENIVYPEIDRYTRINTGVELSRKYSVRYLGRLPYDPDASIAIEEGDLNRLVESRVSSGVNELLVKLRLLR